MRYLFKTIKYGVLIDEAYNIKDRLISMFFSV